jgi:hypothetical protein
MNINMAKEETLHARMRNLFFHPKKFLDSIEGEKNYSKIMFFYVKITLAALIIDFILSIVTIVLRNSGIAIVQLIGQTLLREILSLGLAFISPFVLAAIVHLGVLILRGKQKYFNTYKPIAYAAAISVVYSIIANAVTWLISMINSSTFDPSNLTPELLFQNTGFIAAMAIYGIITLIGIINVFYVSTQGVSKFQKISKLRAFLAIIFIPLITLIIAIVLLIIFGLSAYNSASAA